MDHSLYDYLGELVKTTLWLMESHRELFLIMIADIDKDVSASNLISFADDTRLYSGVGDVTDCDNLQFDLDTVYDWASSHNMFSYVSFSSNGAAYKATIFLTFTFLICTEDAQILLAGYWEHLQWEIPI